MFEYRISKWKDPWKCLYKVISISVVCHLYQSVWFLSVFKDFPLFILPLSLIFLFYFCICNKSRVQSNKKTAFWTYSEAYVKHIFHNGQPTRDVEIPYQLENIWTTYEGTATVLFHRNYEFIIWKLKSINFS